MRRGKRVDNGEWVYGYYVYTHGRHRIIYEDYEGFYCEEEVVPDTVGQYTGKHDKNGKEIYALDKIKAGGFEYIVKWNNKAAAWFCEPIQQEHKITTSKPLFEVLEDWEGVVVGTAFDNPELLKEVESV